MPKTVGACSLYVASTIIAAIAVDDIVVAYAVESPFSVPAVDVAYCEVFSLRRGRAMHDNLVDVSHSDKVFLVIEYLCFAYFDDAKLHRENIAAYALIFGRVVRT